MSIALSRFLVLGVLALNSLTAQVSEGKLTGLWHAKLGREENPCDIYLKLKVDNEGKLGGSLAAPAFADAYMDMPLPQVRLEGGTLDVGLARLKVSDDGSDLSGDFSFFGPSVAARFVRCATLPAPEVDQTPATKESEVWAFTTQGEIWSTPCVAGDRVVFGSDDGLIRAVRLTDGALLWQYPTKNRVRSQAALDGTRVYLCGDDGMLYCLDLAKGSLLWSVKIAASPLPRSLPSYETASDWDYTSASPLVHQGRVLVGSSSGDFLAVDAVTGAKCWSRNVGAPIRAGAAVAGELVIFGDWKGKVHALELETGREHWTYDAHMQVVSTPAVIDGDIVLGSRYTHLWRLNGRSGTERWTFNYWWSWVESSATIAEGKVFIGSSDARKVFALDAGSGLKTWETRTNGYPWMRPTLHRGSLYVGTLAGAKETPSCGFLYVLDAATGRIQKKITVSGGQGVQISGVSTQAVITGELLIFGATDGKLHALRR